MTLYRPRMKRVWASRAPRQKRLVGNNQPSPGNGSYPTNVVRFRFNFGIRALNPADASEGND